MTDDFSEPPHLIWSDERYLVWSNEHGGWWGPGRHGYVPAIADAGRYTHAQAMEICATAMPGTVQRTLGVLPELPVRETDAVVLAMYAEKLRTPRQGGG